MTKAIYSNKKRSLRWGRFKNEMPGYVFTLPFIIGLAILFLPAIVESLVFSFSEIDLDVIDGTMTTSFIGLDNFNHVFNVAVAFRENLIEILITMAINVPIILIFSFLIAIIINQKFKGRGFIRMVFFIPVIIGSGVVARMQAVDMLQEMYGMGGASADIGSELAVEWLNLGALVSFFVSLGFGGVFLDFVIIAIDRLYIILISSGVQIVIYLSALQSVPLSLYEASYVEGCSGWESFWKITLPIVSPIIAVNAVYTIIDQFLDPRNGLNELIRSSMFVRGEFAQGAAMTWIYFLAAGVILAIMMLFISRLIVYYED